MSDHPIFDPVKQGVFTRQTPTDYVGRVVEACSECEQETPHDSWEAIFGAHIGFALPFGRKSTKGKAGKKSNWRFCAVCGAVTALDEEAEKVLLSSQ